MPIHRTSFRKDHFGELLQVDATPYQWFLWSGDSQYYALHGIIDDATSKVLSLWMSKNECSYGYLACRRIVFEKYGIELEDYSDKSPIFSNNYKEKGLLSIENQLAGDKKKVPLWERINKELNIKLTLANSSQAKGKVERLWRVIQQRLPFQLKQRRLTAKMMDAVNFYLNNEYTKYHNAHFRKVPKSNETYFRPIQKDMNIDNILCVKEKRMVYKTLSIKYKGLKIKVVGLKYWYSGLQCDFCINEQGIFFLIGDKRYEAQVVDGELGDAPQVLEEIIYDAIYNDVHEHVA